MAQTKERQKQWYAENRKEILARRRQYYRDNREIVLKRAKENNAKPEVRHKKAAWRAKPKSRFNHAKRKAKEKNVEFSLGYEEYTELISRHCFYCKGKLETQGIGLDQVNPGQGYMTWNVVPCCRECNKLKNNQLSLKEMIIVIESLKVLRGIENLWTPKN